MCRNTHFNAFTNSNTIRNCISLSSTNNYHRTHTDTRAFPDNIGCSCFCNCSGCGDCLVAGLLQETQTGGWERVRKISVLFALFLAVSPLIVLLPAVEASVITVSSPTGNAIYNNNVLPMSVKVYSGETSGSSAIVYIEYVTSWQPNSTVSIWSWDPGFGRELMAQLANPRRPLTLPRK